MKLRKIVGEKIYLIGSVCISILFLIFLLAFGVSFFPLSGMELLNIVAGGTILALLIIATPYLALQVKRDLKKRRRKPKQYAIQLVTNEPPERDAEVLAMQSKRINLILKDLDELCKKCLTKKCSKCSIKKEVIPALRKAAKQIT